MIYTEICVDIVENNTFKELIDNKYIKDFYLDGKIFLNKNDIKFLIEQAKENKITIFKFLVILEEAFVMNIPHLIIINKKYIDKEDNLIFKKISQL